MWLVQYFRMRNWYDEFSATLPELLKVIHDLFGKIPRE